MSAPSGAGSSPDLALKPSTSFPESFRNCFEKEFLFVQGKGGVGKSTFAEAAARLLSRTHRTLLVSIDDPLRKPGEVRSLGLGLDHVNAEATAAFEEYAGVKIGAPNLVKVFLQNRLMRYLAKAAPGVRELVLLGKIWFERRHYGRIVIDMPATGHGLTMFQSLFNWGGLFAGGPLAKDADAMIATFSDPKQVSHLVVSLAEEMPLVESLELRDHLLRIFPESQFAFIANRLFPSSGAPITSDRPFAATAAEHAARKSALENENLAIWKGIDYARFPWFPPTPEDAHAHAVDRLLHALEKGVHVEPAVDPTDVHLYSKEARP
jgi:energy-coupling factor transporter ATP-binding protein EcfA2